MTPGKGSERWEEEEDGSWEDIKHNMVREKRRVLPLLNGFVRPGYLTRKAIMCITMEIKKGKWLSFTNRDANNVNSVLNKTKHWFVKEIIEHEKVVVSHSKNQSSH